METRTEKEYKTLTCFRSMASEDPIPCLGSGCSAWTWASPEIGAAGEFHHSVIADDDKEQMEHWIAQRLAEGWEYLGEHETVYRCSHFRFIGPRKGYCAAMQVDFLEVEVSHS